MTRKLIDNLKKQIKELQTDLVMLVNSAEKRRKDVRGIIPYIGEFGELDYITKKVIELHNLLSILIINRQKEDRRIK